MFDVLFRPIDTYSLLMITLIMFAAFLYMLTLKITPIQYLAQILV